MFKKKNAAVLRKRDFSSKIVRQNGNALPKGEKIDRFVLKLPVYGNLKVQVALSDIVRTLALLSGAGISILESLEIVAKTSGNVVFEKALAEPLLWPEASAKLLTL